MRALLSPYELDEWSPAAMAAVSLFDAVATLRPELAGDEAGRAEPERLKSRELPALALLLDRWHWSGPLWRSGVLVPEADGARVLDAAREAAEAFRADPRLGPLHRLTGRPWHADGADAMEAMAGDVLRKGGDPSIHLPVVAALESLAMRTGGVLCRGEGAGMLGRLERRGVSRAVARFALPTLIGGDGDVVLAARDRLASPREALVQALQNTVAGNGDALRSARLLEAADHYALAFDALFGGVPVLRGAHSVDGMRRTMLVVSIASSPPAPTLGATARLASIVGGRRHDRLLAGAARAVGAECTDATVTGGTVPQGEELLIATIKRVAWEPTRA